MWLTLVPVVVVALARPGAVEDVVAAKQEVRAVRLAAAVQQTAPRYLTPARALEHARAAVAAELPDVPAELLLGMAYVESRYTVDSVSRVQGSKRVTGKVGTKVVGRGPYFCGVVQTAAKHSWARCLAMRDVRLGYQLGAEELQQWRRACTRKRVRDVETCMLNGHGGGWPAVERATSTYPRRVKAREARIRRIAARLDNS